MTTSVEDIAAAYARRLESGLYDSIAQQMVGMGNASLAACDYQKDFVRKVEHWSGNYVYCDHTNGEFRTNIVGEIAPASSGTIMSAKGNHYSGKANDFRRITDESKCKDVIALRVPTSASGLLKVIYYNQVGAMNAVREADEVEESDASQNPAVREWVRAPGTNITAPSDIILLHMMPKYGKPGGKGSPVKRVHKRSLEEMEAENPTDETDAGPEIKLGAFYDPNLNVDFGGDFFNLTHNKLAQLDVRDEDNNLIPPWKHYESLRPGTLILANVSLHCFIMNGPGTHRKTYQANLHSARVLSQSPLPVVMPARPTVPISATTAVNATPATNSPSSEASSAFANFVTTPTVSPTNTPPSSQPSTPSKPSGAAKTQVLRTTVVCSNAPMAPNLAEASGVVPEESGELPGAPSQHVDKKARRSRKKESGGEQGGDSAPMDTGL